MITAKILVMIALLALLLRVSRWAIPLLAAYAGGGAVLALGSGWLMALTVAFVAACVVQAATSLGMASGSRGVRLAAALLILAPSAWAGAFALRAMAVEAGARGAVWPAIAAIIGALLFSALTAKRVGRPLVATQRAPSNPVAASSHPVPARIG